MARTSSLMRHDLCALHMTGAQDGRPSFRIDRGIRAVRDAEGAESLHGTVTDGDPKRPDAASLRLLLDEARRGPVAIAGVLTGFILIGDTWWQLVTAAVLAVVLTQVAMLGHDAAHRQIFRSGRWNDWTTLVIGNLLVGMSYGWWQHKHTRHHANPNKIGSDPDIELSKDACLRSARMCCYPQSQHASMAYAIDATVSSDWPVSPFTVEMFGQGSPSAPENIPIRGFRRGSGTRGMRCRRWLPPRT